MPQAISYCSHSSDDSEEFPPNIRLPSSPDSSLVSSAVARLQTPPFESLTTDLLLVAINHTGTSRSINPPPSNLPPLSRLKSPSFVASSPQVRASKASEGRGAVLGSNGLVGLGISSTSNLVMPPNRNTAHWKIQDLREESEDGSDLGLANVSPITYAASPLASPTEGKFAIATQHLRQHQDVVAKAEVVSTAEKQRKLSLERKSSEEVIVVPDFRPREVSAADRRRRKRRLERRSSAANAPFVNREVVQRGWVRRV